MEKKNSAYANHLFMTVFCLVTGFIFIMVGVFLIYVQTNLIPVVLAILLGLSMLYLGVVKFLERRGQKAFENKDSQD